MFDVILTLTLYIELTPESAYFKFMFSDFRFYKVSFLGACFLLNRPFANETCSNKVLSSEETLHQALSSEFPKHPCVSSEYRTL